MRKIILNVISILFLLILLVSCAPETKETEKEKVDNLETKLNLENVTNSETKSLSNPVPVEEHLASNESAEIITINPPVDPDTPLSVIKSEAIIYSSYNYQTGSPDIATNYDVYYVNKNPNLRVVCQQPCPIPESILRKKTLGAYYAVNELLDLTKIDVLPNFQPVDVHLSSDQECGNYTEILAEKGYVYRFAGTKHSKIGGSYLCLWEWEDDNLVLPLNEENAEKIQGQMVLVHEYGHILFYGRSFASPEHFMKALSFYISGLWDGNGLEETNFPKITGACDPREKARYQDIYNLCTNCNFQMSDISTLLIEIDKLYQNNQGEEDVGGVKPKVSIPQMKKIIDQITGKDSVTDCKVEWLGDSCSNC